MTFLLSLASAASWVLAPVLVWQGRRVRQRIVRLSEAEGERRGVVQGAAPPWHLLVIGDSTAAGVGAQTQPNALGAQTAEGLRQRSGRAVAWQVEGRNGRKIADVLRTLERLPPHTAAEVVVVCVGVNDGTGMTGVCAWRRGVGELCAALQLRFQGARVLFSGLPPVHEFPALPVPLRQVIGLRCHVLDRALREELTARRDASYVPLTFAADSSLLAADGFHPGIAAYRHWAGELARRATT